MSQLMVLIVRQEDDHEPERLTELWRQRLPEIRLDGVEAERYLDQLESGVGEGGFEVIRQLMVEQWRQIDEALVARYRPANGADVIVGDGTDNLKVASRFGVVQLPRQVGYRVGEAQHVLPGNAALPAHEGQVTTRGVQEWACLLPQDLPFSTAQRLLGWNTHDSAVLSETQLRRLVVHHGQIVRAAERAEVTAFYQEPDATPWQAVLVPVGEARRPAAWEPDLAAVVEAALAQPNAPAPEGIRPGDWERVIQARQTQPQATVEQLRRLGPEVPPGEIVASTDDIQVRGPDHRRWLEIRTA